MWLANPAAEKNSSTFNAIASDLKFLDNVQSRNFPVSNL